MGALITRAQFDHRWTDGAIASARLDRGEGRSATIPPLGLTR
jgi:hypothetical protein